MKLVICEKPSVAKAVASALNVTSRADGCFEGNGYLVSWCVGHLVSPMDSAGAIRRSRCLRRSALRGF